MQKKAHYLVADDDANDDGDDDIADDDNDDNDHDNDVQDCPTAAARSRCQFPGKPSTTL